MLHPNHSAETDADMKQTAPNAPSTGILKYIRAVGASALVVLMGATEEASAQNRPQAGNQPRGAAAAQRAPGDGSVLYVDGNGKQYVGLPASNAEIAQFNAQKAAFPGWTTFILNGQRYIGIPPNASNAPIVPNNNQVRPQTGTNDVQVPAELLKKDPSKMSLADGVSVPSTSSSHLAKVHMYNFYTAAAPSLEVMAASKDEETAKDARLVLEALTVAIREQDSKIIGIMGAMFTDARANERAKGKLESEFLPSGVHEVAQKWEALRASNPVKYLKHVQK